MISSLRLIDLVFLSVLLASMLSIAGAEDSLACDTDGEFFHNTENCNTYYVCVHGQKVLMPCNTGLVFSLQETTCVPEDHDLNDCEPSSNADDPLSCDTDGEFFHNNENCNTYYVCDHGQKTLMPCITGLVFSLQGKTCVQKGTEGLDDCVEVTERKYYCIRAIKRPESIAFEEEGGALHFTKRREGAAFLKTYSVVNQSLPGYLYLTFLRSMGTLSKEEVEYFGRFFPVGAS